MRNFTIAYYNDADGGMLTQGEVQIEYLDAGTVDFFSSKIARLSGDMELPLELKLPGKFSQAELLIVSDLHAAYVLYYWLDEVVFASLYLRGDEPEKESEMAQVFRFLLLDNDEGEEEPSDEEIDAVLNSAAFDFLEIEDRPAAYAIRFSSDQEHGDALQHIEKMDQHLAAAFLAGR